MSVSLFKIHNYFFKNLRKKKTLFYATFLCGRYNNFKKKKYERVENTTLKSCSEKLKSNLFSLLP